MNEISKRIREHAARWPGKPAVIECGIGGAARAVGYAELAAMATRFATALADRIGGEHRVVPIYAQKSAACIAAMLGASEAGGAFAFMNPRLRAAQIERILTVTGSPVAMVDGACLRGLAAADPDSIIRRTRWCLLPTVPQLPAAMRERLSGDLDIGDDWAPADPGAPIDVAALDGGRVQCCLFTSGSTGEPKGVLIASDDLARRADCEAQWYELSERDVLLSLLPFSFDVGMNQLLSSLWAAATLVLSNSWLPGDILRLCEVHGVTGISSVPSLWRDMMAAGAVFDTKGVHDAIRYATISGGDLDPGGLAAMTRLLSGVGIYKTYGQTETFRSSSLHPEEYSSKVTSVGRPFSPARFYVVDANGAPCGPGEEGEVVHTGLGTMVGYIDSRPSQLRPNPFCGPDDPAAHAVFTGDRGVVDAEGYLYLKGRRDDMAKIQGNRVYPPEVAAEMLTLAEIEDAEVLVIGDDCADNYLAGFVMAADDSAERHSRIRTALAKRLPGYMVPRRLVLLKRFPRTASGKTDRAALVRLVKD